MMSNDMSGVPAYWLATWLASRRIEDVKDAEALLSDDEVIDELRDVAEQWAESADLPPRGLNLVAGTGLRLDDLLTCPGPSCRKQQVDVLFRHAWHYFDYILLPDGFGELLRHPPKSWPRDFFRRSLLDMIDITLHIQQIGGSPLVWYYPKPKALGSTIKDAVDELGQESWADAWNEVEHTLAANGTVEYKAVGQGSFLVHLNDPLLGVSSNIVVRASKNNRKAICAEAIHSFLHEHIGCLEQDLASARIFGGALGSAVWSHEHVLTRTRGLGEYDLALRLSLPSLASVPIRDLISLRIAERDAFDAFRGSLTRAAAELIRAKDNKKANDVVQDIVEPELARIRQRLRTAQRALARKAALSVVLGAISMTCGVLTGLPLGGLAGLGVFLPGVATAGAKYMDEKQAVEMSDMFFLWKALEHAKDIRN